MILLALATSAAATALAQPSLTPLAPLLGHCWSGPAPQGPGIDTHCFESFLNGRHVRDRHEVVVDGKTVYAGESVYSDEGGKLSFTYWNSFGGIGHGTATASGESITFSGETRPAAGAPPEPSNAVWRLNGAGYDVIWPGGKTVMRRAD
jgi:hypothetical protein